MPSYVPPPSALIPQGSQKSAQRFFGKRSGGQQGQRTFRKESARTICPAATRSGTKRSWVLPSPRQKFRRDNSPRNFFAVNFDPALLRLSVRRAPKTRLSKLRLSVLRSLLILESYPDRPKLFVIRIEKGIAADARVRLFCKL